MPIRTTVLLNIRPEIAEALLSENMSAEERFQNITIRPILKLQHELLIDVFKNYIAKHKNVFYELSLPKQLDYIENAIHKDMKFRNSLKGMIIGQFTIEEYSAYTQNSSALNKRIMNMVKASFIDHLQVFMPNLAKAI
ncbi:MAG TPA: glyoxalase [Aquaticitalea sp.]|nr:glyoxalase [Aquaticitalea sp.]